MELDRDLYEKISDLTGTDYKPIFQKDAEAPVIVTNIESMLEELLMRYEELEKKYDETERYYIENWQPIPVSKQVGMIDKDFC